MAAVVEQALAAFPVTMLTGARQTGKTTLVQHQLSAVGRAFRTLDDLRVLDLAEREPDLLVHEAERITLDEVQRVPDLLRAIKRAVDEKRRPGRFLLTGSANLLLMRAVSESLAGRAVYLRLGPLSEPEKRGSAELPVWGELVSAGDVDFGKRAIERARATRRPWAEAVCEGGYPAVLALADTDRTRWFESYVTTYLERDLQQLSTVGALADFRRLLEVSALRLGGLVNRAELARDAALSRPTAHRYLNLLEVSFQIRLLRPYAKSRTSRVVKSPKLYWTDTGLAAHLAGIADGRDLGSQPLSGALLENLILCQLDVWRETVVPRAEVYYWRTASGAEVDFVIEQRRRLLPIEVKSGSTVRHSDCAGLERFLGEHRSAAYGIIAYGGDAIHAITPRVLAVPINRLV